ncbi:MAG: TMEM165/GDT1 family protein [Cyanobacteria bacterium P01_F01_bin.150]
MTENPTPSPNPESQAGIRLFFTTFFTIFVAELGDKTQITTLLISAESQSPWIVFIGAAVALLFTTLLGIFVGRWLSNHVKKEIMETVTGMILLGISALLLWDILHM